MAKQTKQTNQELLIQKASSSVNFQLSKDDIFLVMQQEKIDEIERKLEDLRLKLKTNEELKTSLSEKIKAEFFSLHKIKGSNITCSNLFTVKDVWKQYAIYNIDSLISMSGFPRNINNYKYKKTFRFFKSIELYKNGNIEVSKTIKDSEGFEGNVCKSLPMKRNAKMNSILKDLENAWKEEEKLKLEINDLEFEQVRIEKDKTYKVNFIKQIIANNESLQKVISQ